MQENNKTNEIEHQKPKINIGAKQLLYVPRILLLILESYLRVSRAFPSHILKNEEILLLTLQPKNSLEMFLFYVIPPCKRPLFSVLPFQIFVIYISKIKPNSSFPFVFFLAFYVLPFKLILYYCQNSYSYMYNKSENIFIQSEIDD